MAKKLPLFERARNLGERLPGGPTISSPFVYGFSETSLSDLIARIRVGGHPAVCDSSAFRRESPELARKVLANTSAIIPPEALQELKPLKADRSATELCEVLFPGGNIAPQIRATSIPFSLRILREYYAELLAERKKVISRGVDEFIRREQREPTIDERNKLVDDAKIYGARTAWLAQKNDQDGSPQSVVDEIVLGLGIATALQETRDVLILTDDLDLLEQFYKLTSLLRDDIAAHLLAEDYSAKPECYPPRLPLPMELQGFTTDVAASFLIQRPSNLDRYFTGPTVNITVARIREQGECISWCAPMALAGFLEEKSSSWRNSTKFGNANVYIQLPLRRTGQTGRRGRCYAFFLTDGSGESDGNRRRVSRADVTRVLFDHEDFDVDAATASTYRYASHLWKAGARSEAFSVASKLLHYTDSREGHRISALGHAQAAFAAAAYEEHLDPTEALHSLERLVAAFGHARASDLRGLALGSQLNHARARARTGDMEGAIKEWGVLELSCALDRDPYAAFIGRAAGLNRALNYCLLDSKGAPGAIERFLVHLGWPPADLHMYRIALYGLVLALLDIGKVDCVLGRVSELLRLAQQTARIDSKLVAIEGYSSIIALVAARGEKNAASAMLSSLIVGIARESFPMAALRRAADLLKSSVQRIQLRDLLMMKTIISVGPQCRCCPPALWARGDCMMAKVQLSANGPGVGAFLFHRVRKTYGLLAATDKLIADVIRDCDREIEMATKSDSTPTLTSERSSPTSLDLLDIVVLTPGGKPRPP